MTKSKREILLITPNDTQFGFEYSYSARENLGVEYLISSIFKEGHSVRSINLNFDNTEYISEVLSQEYDIIGFSLTFWEYREHYITFINSFQDKTNSILIAGGHAATIGAKYFLTKCPKLDGIVLGEGEETIVDLINNSTNFKRFAIPGYYSRKGFIKRKQPDIRILSFPKREELERILQNNPYLKETYLVNSRGCTYTCSFCSINPFYNSAHYKTWQLRDENDLCHEITALLNEFPGLELLSFTDDNFLGYKDDHKERAIRISNHIRNTKDNLVYEIACRADAIDEYTFKELGTTGLSGVFLGIESGVQRVLNSFKKRITVEQNIKSIEILNTTGVGVDIGFIMFSEDLSLDELIENFKFLFYIFNNYDIYIHPAAIFKSYKFYPSDLGISALNEEYKDSCSCLDKNVDFIRIELEKYWARNLRHKFLQIEKNLASDNNFNDFISSKNITKSLLDTGIHLVHEVSQKVY